MESRRRQHSWWMACLWMAYLWTAAALVAATAHAAGPLVRYGDPVPRDVREMYDAGLRYLLKSQDDSGAWKDGQAGPGVTGMAVMALLASGEDPNHGPYRVPIRKALRSMIVAQNAETGFLGSGQGHDSMYQHGFGMLALAEAYGAVDDRMLWTEASAGGQQGRPLGQALELATRCAVTSARNNPLGGWRYSADAKDADTSNAGIEVPDETIDKAIRYFTTMTGPNGQLGYSGGPGGGSDAVTSIGVLVYSIAQQKGLPQYGKSLAYLRGRSLAVEQGGMEGYPTYTRYYRAQALFQGDVDVWEKWNAGLVKELKGMQAKDGSLVGGRGGMGMGGGTVTT